MKQYQQSSIKSEFLSFTKYTPKKLTSHLMVKDCLFLKLLKGSTLALLASAKGKERRNKKENGG